MRAIILYLKFLRNINYNGSICINFIRELYFLSVGIHFLFVCFFNFVLYYDNEYTLFKLIKGL